VPSFRTATASRRPLSRNLLDYAALKLLAVRVGASESDRKRDLVNIKFRQNAGIDPGMLAKFVSSQRGAQFTPDGNLKFSLKVSGAPEILGQLRSLLEELSASGGPSTSHVGTAALDHAG